MVEYANTFELIKDLKHQGVSDVEIASQVNSYLMHKAYESKIPYRGSFELLPMCNFKCKMCYVQLPPNQVTQPLLSFDEWKDIMFQAYKEGMAEAVLTGGECLLLPYFKELYLFLVSLGIKIEVYTNGFLINKDIIDLFKRYPPSVIQISLYGSNDDAYEAVTGNRVFGQVWDNIRSIKDNGLPLRVAVTPSCYMQNDVYNIIDILYKEGINYNINSSLTIPRSETGRGKENHDLAYDDYISIMKHRCELEGIKVIPQTENEVPNYNKRVAQNSKKGLRCYAGTSSFQISWDGKMHPCSMIQRIEADPFEMGFLEAWRMINKFSMDYQRIPQCEDCAFQKSCFYCPGVLDSLAGEGIQYEPWCNRTRNYALEGLLVIQKDCEV